MSTNQKNLTKKFSLNVEEKLTEKPAEHIKYISI